MLQRRSLCLRLDSFQQGSLLKGVHSSSSHFSGSADAVPWLPPGDASWIVKAGHVDSVIEINLLPVVRRHCLLVFVPQESVHPRNHLKRLSMDSQTYGGNHLKHPSMDSRETSDASATRCTKP